MIKPSIVLILATVVAVTGCAAEGIETSPEVDSCYPSYEAPSEYGRFTAQQGGPGEGIQWGAYPYPAYRGDQYVVSVYLGGVKVDGKNQPYAPHGSIGPKRVQKYGAGSEFEISGTVKSGGKVVLEFSLKCEIA